MDCLMWVLARHQIARLRPPKMSEDEFYAQFAGPGRFSGWMKRLFTKLFR